MVSSLLKGPRLSLSERVISGQFLSCSGQGGRFGSAYANFGLVGVPDGWLARGQVAVAAEGSA